MRPPFLSSTRISHLALCEQVNVRMAGCVGRKPDHSQGEKDLREKPLTLILNTPPEPNRPKQNAKKYHIRT